MSTFRLFGLPCVPIDLIASIWEPPELCNFSTLSKKALKISKSLKKKPSILTFSADFQLGITFSLWVHVENIWFYEVPYTSRNPIDNGFLKFFEILDQLQEIYNCSMHSMKINFQFLTVEESNLFAEWININQKISKMVIATITGNSENIPLKFPKQLEIDELRSQETGGSEWMNLENLMNLNSIYIYLSSVSITNQDLNSFLKNWAEGKSNSRLKVCNFSMLEVMDFRTILRGLTFEIRDPRTTRRSFQCDSTKLWIRSGIDIQKNDGTIGTIPICWDSSEYEHENLSPHLTVEYENVMKIMNGEEVTDDDSGQKLGFMQFGIGHYGCNRRWFSFIVW